MKRWACLLGGLLCTWMLAARAQAPDAIEAEFAYGGLQITFPEPMRIWDNARDGHLVRLEPALAAVCSWDSDTDLSCAFDEEAAPLAATRYRISLAPGLKTQTGVAVPATVLWAETPRPTLRAWVESWHGGVPVVSISGNQPMTAAAVAKVLRLQVDGKAHPLQTPRPMPKHGPWDRSARFMLELSMIEGRDRVSTLSVVPGLRGSDGPLTGTQSEPLLALLLGEPPRLRGGACSVQGRALEATVRDGALVLDCLPDELLGLHFSRPLDEDSRQRFIDALPDGVAFRGWARDWGGQARAKDAAQTAPADIATLVLERPEVEVSFALPDGLRAGPGGEPFEPARVTLRSGVYRPALRAPTQRMLVADGAAPPSLVRAYNSRPLVMLEQALGAGSRTGRFDTPAASPTQPEPLSSPDMRRALAEGGWVRWRLEPRGAKAGGAPLSARLQTPPLQFAAPGFDLSAVAGRREVLAWTNAWEGDAPVAGAHVELLWLDDMASAPRVVAAARTGDDGVAWLRLPDDLVAARASRSDGLPPMWLLRATSGRGRDSTRAVLPAWEANPYGAVLGEARARAWWGVADKPLYRAGDNVRYRLWQRERDGNRLRAIVSPQLQQLRLYNDDEDKTLRTWTLAPAEDGSYAGEVALPIHLTDGTYCIGVGDTTDGTCFFVGTYRAQDLWAEAKAVPRTLRDGDRFEVEVEAGYYSGGPAADVALSRVSTRVVGVALEQAFPEYADYRFVDVRDDVRPDLVLADAAALVPVTDATGRARIALPVAFASSADGPVTPPAFGELQLVAEVRLSDREGTASNAAKVRYTRFERFVGLRTDPRWLDATTPVSLQAVVIDAEGRAQPDAPVSVEVHFLPGIRGAEPEPAPELLARCDVPAGTTVRCDFPRARGGRYRFTASSGDAAPARVEQVVWITDASLPMPRTALELVRAPAAAGEPVRVLLTQSARKARALFVFSAGDRLLAHRVVAVEGRGAEIELPTMAGPEWRGPLRLAAWVRDPDSMRIVDGLRLAPDLANVSIELALSARTDAAEPIALAFDPSGAAPGERRILRIRNTGSVPRDVTLAVVDDALRALASPFLRYFDPLGERWLGRQPEWRERPAGVSFASWATTHRWQQLLPGDDAVRPASTADEDACGESLNAAEAAACRAAEAAEAAADAAAAMEGAVKASPGLAAAMPPPAPPPPPPEPPVVFDDPSPVDTPLPQETGRMPAAPPYALRALGGNAMDEHAQLDSIVVTGSRLADAGLPENAKPAQGLHPRDPSGAPVDRMLRELARVRTNFADTALWLPQLRLAPGEERDIEVTLPDNLTRWRALAWSSDRDDDFHLAEATLDAGLPLEVRLQAPVRLYPGDASRLAANVRQSGEGAIEAQVAMTVEGIGAPMRHLQPLALGARGQASFAFDVAPRETGSLRAVASAQAASNADAVGSVIEVASPLIAASKVQAGWLGDAPLALQLPVPPAGARDPTLSVALLHGTAGLVDRWTRDLHAYPHRCWEQILSRALAAALALERGDADAWPDARASVDEALDNAAVFQDGDGLFRYFADSLDDDDGLRGGQQVALTAYTLRAFAVLRRLGHQVDAGVERDARDALQSFIDGGAGELGLDEDDEEDMRTLADLLALSLDALGAVEPDLLDEAQSFAPGLSLPARIALARALVAQRHPLAGELVAGLLRDAPARGPVRVLRESRDGDRWMGSPLREQCALIDLLRTVGDDAALRARGELVAGLSDLYAGGVEAVDTQAGATCLLALRDQAEAGAGDAALVLQAGTADETTLALRGDRARDDWQGAPPADGVLRLQPRAAQAPASYVAELSYVEDGRFARASAVGLSIERRYSVLRDGDWRPIDDIALREGDWLRITLVVRNGRSRHFVALTDAVPGGLRPTDLALSAIAGLDLERVSDEGGAWFGTRRLDPRSPKFYAEFLPAGEHEVHYFARVGNSGDYLAAPATAELMYGSASRARTDARRITIAPPSK